MRMGWRSDATWEDGWAGAAYLRCVSRQRREERSMGRWIGGQCERV